MVPEIEKFKSKKILTYSMIRTIKVSEKGQIAIPRPIREIMGIERGDELVIVQSGSKMLIEKAGRAEKRIKEEFKDVLKHSENSLKDVWDNKSDNVWNRYLRKR